MKTIQEILSNVDDLIRNSRLQEAEQYMRSELKSAEESGEYTVSITLLNEMCGFYRDIGQLNRAIECCTKAEEYMDKIGVGDTKQRAAAYLNTANAYRANHDLEESFSYYQKARKILDVCGDASLNSSYYNNLALLHQEAGKFDKAEECLRKALYIAEEHLHDEIRIAISRTNLATSLLRMKRVEEAKEILLPAIKIFEARVPSDFHYSAALSAMGDMNMLMGKPKQAAEYFEMALSEIELHMGKNNFYEIVTDNLESAYKMLGGRPLLKGMDICRKYFEAFGKPVIKKYFGNLTNHMACGLAGAGSECLSFDDETSRDHDFGPGFCIWIDDQVSDDDAKRLQQFYDALPKEYMGIKRIATTEASGRVGVIRIKDALKKATGFDHVPKGEQEWQYTVDENLVLIVNGEIFMDEAGVMTSVRKAIRNNQPHFVYFGKLAMQLELMAKHGQYGYERAIKRGDMVTAFMTKSEFIKSAMRAMHIIAKKYGPYNKWLRKSLGNIPEFDKAAAIIDELAISSPSDQDLSKMGQICDIVREALMSRGLISGKETYLLQSAYELKALANKAVVADQIVELEFMQFDKTQNEGGRANCQDDWATFSIMRRSQYYTWPMELLQTLLVDYTEAARNGRNVITEKYGYMMESTAPAEFEAIKDKLPIVPEDKKAVMEAIIDIQVTWIEEFADKYPELADNARVIHTKDDTPFITSYETYLRGELSTYHDDTLALYGRFIAQLSSEGKNLASMIMNMTTFFYGYASLDAAKEAQR